jgi:hypothetical protein
MQLEVLDNYLNVIKNLRFEEKNESYVDTIVDHLNKLDYQ